ncbi:hypothetical protein HPB51_003833 [Rhipicephalus microplus]|uniref:Uncharacterized protein n=1 Tax=Rhipicephalus microplus TaxID=6941 RepID=A0A9J6ELQ8_RHIMP|nr:uncharacterized protein LOC119181785 [Rhipicephalus microplus]KAH8034992.1 hypothetical protein HPB51_003833 [Rhipicephalus microplus]
MATTISSRFAVVPRQRWRQQQQQPSVLSQWHAVVFYFVLVFADHMQNPYEYKLYYYNNLEQKAIAQIYAIGALGGCFADLWGRSFAKRVGWKLSAALLLALLMQSCLMKNTDDLLTLMISKILAKICVLTLFPLAVGQFSARTKPSETATMIGNGFIGIVSGVTGSLLCDVIYFDCFIIFYIAAFVLGALFLFHWLAPPPQSIREFLEPYRSDRVVTLAVLSSEAGLWCCSTVVEAYWTPLVNPSKMNVGLLYALYCLFHVFGGCFFRVTRVVGATPRYTLTLACLLAAIGMFFVAAAMPLYPDSVLVIVMAMLAFHFALGLWGVALRKLRDCVPLSPLNETYCPQRGYAWSGPCC